MRDNSISPTPLLEDWDAAPSLHREFGCILSTTCLVPYSRTVPLQIMKQTCFISFSQFATENGGFSKVSPCKVEGMPQGVVYIKHRADGSTTPVKGITFLTKNGSEVVCLLDNELQNKTLNEIVAMRGSAGVAKSYYTDANGSERESYTFYASRSRFDEANSISLD